MAKGRKRFESSKQGPRITLQPTDLLHFIELTGFSDDWQHLGLDDDDLSRLQFALMEGAKNSPVIPGTGGLRKMRFAPAGWRVGKRGAIRVCFCWWEAFGIVLLITAYAKNEHSDLSPRAKRMFRKLIEVAEKELEARRRKDSHRGARKQ